MSFKTDRLAALFPDAYAAREGSALLRALLDALGLELMRADASIKTLLKSHWVNYAQGDGLDGLAATFGVERRRLPDGSAEPDRIFRRRLKSTVPSFTGGGTVKAVAGAVRSALGLPYDLEAFRNEIAGPGGDPTGKLTPLVDALTGLVRVEEFTPKPETVLSSPVTVTGDQSSVMVEIDYSSTQQVYPRIEWTFPAGGGRELTVQRLDTGTGVRSRPALVVAPGSTLVLSAVAGGTLSAAIGTSELSSQFTAWDGVSPAFLPELPGGHSKWAFTAKGSAFDTARLDAGDTFDAPDFAIRIVWTRRQPLTFDVIVPYFLRQAVDAIKAATGFGGELFSYEGLPLEIIQKVVDQARAAGVRGTVHFSLSFADGHAMSDQLTALVDRADREVLDMQDVLTVGSVDSATERHELGEVFVIGGVFDVARFDGSFGFQ